MARKYSPSVNIIRDREKTFAYIPTPNGRRVVAQMGEDFQKGIRAFNIIGSYGTGKSSFLLALEQSLRGKNAFYEPAFVPRPSFEAITIIGEYGSIIDAFAAELGVEEKTDREAHILTELLVRYRALGKKGALLFVVVDEFGKFLEYAAKHDAERELYFVQRLAEFANNAEHNIVFVTTVHQSFESYAHNLGGVQKNEWTKVKGRFREILFNEPVEHLLYLASQYLKETAADKPAGDADIAAMQKLFSKSKAFDTADAFAKELGTALYPLDLFAAHVLTLALQRYGQNERSLFSFLESTDHTSLEKFRFAQAAFYNLAHVYDYLNFNLYSYLWSGTNPNGGDWGGIKLAMEKMERTVTKDTEAYAQIIKTIGLLNIFAAEGSVLDEAFLTAYCRVCLRLENAPALIKSLQDAKIIRFKNYRHRYLPFDGTDVDIQRAIHDAEGSVDRATDVAALVQKHYTLPPLLAKQHAFRTGTPRYFQFLISKEPIVQEAAGEVDGFINLVFNEHFTDAERRAASAASKEAVVYAFYQNTADIKTLLFDVEKTEKALDTHRDDIVARREFESILAHQKKLLNHYILDSLYDKAVVWYWDGIVQEVKNGRALNALLSRVCDMVYNRCPVFKNELVNKHKISPQITKAKKDYFAALIENWQQDNLGFHERRFPPEKTIFSTLLLQNGISPADERDVTINPESSFIHLWNYSNAFLEAAEHERLPLNTFVQGLLQRPYKLKQGFIDVWLPTFLFLRRNDFALYVGQSFVPDFSADLLDLLAKQPDAYSVKSFDLGGVRLDLFNRYRTLINQQTTNRPTKRSFVETIRPFIKLYKELTEYTKQTKRLKPKARAVREAVINAKDPEKLFFETFPAALGTSISQLTENESDLKAYAKSLQVAIRELLQCHDELVARFEEFIHVEYGYANRSFEVYKAGLQKRFEKLKRHLLTAEQREFIDRLDSPLDDRGMWLSSLAQTLVGRTLDKFSDDDEPALYDKFTLMIRELDGLTALSKVDIDEDAEEVFGIQLDTFMTEMKRSLVRLPKSRSGEVETIKHSLRSVLSRDTTIDIAALTKLLNELISA